MKKDRLIAIAIPTLLVLAFAAVHTMATDASTLPAGLEGIVAEVVDDTDCNNRNASTPSSSASCDCKCDCESIKARLDLLEKKVAGYELSKKYSGGGSSGTLLQPAKVAPSLPVVAAPAAQVLSATMPKSIWSHPGTIQDHMRSSHGVNVTGMSVQQAEILHSQIHEQTSPGNAIYWTKPAVRSSCPGGVCPASSTKSTMQRPKIFKR